MRIINIMFSRNLGGIEQAFVDYAEALLLRGHQVWNVIQPNSAVQALLEGIDAPFHFLATRNQWDIWAALNLRRYIRQVAPEVVIAHGNRAVSMAKLAVLGLNIPVIGVVHNDSFKRMVRLPGIFTVTNYLRQNVIRAGAPTHRVFHIPNMIRYDKTENAHRPLRGWQEPPVIGTLGRMVKKKGFADFIRALSLLEERGIRFRAILAGEGEERRALHDLCNQLSIKSEIAFPGWIHDKRAFYESIDIFCLPSLQEPFGIVLLEAFLHRKPVVSTRSEGPSEIATHEQDALLVPTHSPGALADTLARLIANPDLAEKLAMRGRQTVEESYTMDRIGERLEEAVQKVSAMRGKKR